jgi:hypothetical protein
MKKVQKIRRTDKVYKLTKRGSSSYLLCCQLRTLQEDSHYYILMKKQVQTVHLGTLRNQRSPFEDEQDGNAVLEPVIFEDGFLNVPKKQSCIARVFTLPPIKW